MTSKAFPRLFTLALIVLGMSHVMSIADDWPQWMGPHRDQVWRETGIVKTVPADGLPVKWRVPVGLGYSGPAVADGRVFVLDYLKESGEVRNNPGGVNNLTGQERVRCFDANNGKLLWEHAYDQPYQLSYAAGPRCTPTIHSGHVYAYGAHGQLSCLNAATGKLVWTKSITQAYKTKPPFWGHSSHPLVVGDLIYVLAGGNGSVCVALNKNTGEEVWRALSASEPGYCPPTLIEHAGVKQLLIWHPESINSLNPATGDVYWSLPFKPRYGMSVMAPRKLGNLLYISAIGNVSAMIKLDDTKPAAEILWRGRIRTGVFAANVTPFLDNGMIYGCDVDTGELIGADMKDGKRLWATTAPTAGLNKRRPRHATAFIVKNGDRFFLFNELGDLVIAKLSRSGYEEQGRFHVLEPTNEAFGRPVVWSYPAYANRCMFARNDKELVCVDLSAK